MQCASAGGSRNETEVRVTERRVRVVELRRVCDAKSLSANLHFEPFGQIDEFEEGLNYDL